MDPLVHYLFYGYKEDKNPSENKHFFYSSKAFLKRNTQDFQNISKSFLKKLLCRQMSLSEIHTDLNHV